MIGLSISALGRTSSFPRRTAGAVAATTDFTHPANGRIEWTQTAVPSSGVTNIHIRRQDSSNLWLAQVTSLGSLYLYERVAGVFTERGTGPGVTAGSLISIVFSGTTITGSVNGVQKWSYASASNFQANTLGRVDSLGTGGIVTDLVVYP